MQSRQLRNEGKRIARYVWQGNIKRQCPHCEEIKDCICYKDTLTKESLHACKKCIREELNFEIVRLKGGDL